jgi:predicted transcriptional regulator
MRERAISLRLPGEMAAALGLLARAEEIAPSEAVRQAIDHYLASRRSDHDFQERLKRRLAEDQEALERLAQ